MLRLKLLQLIVANVWDDVEAHCTAIALLGARASMTNYLIEPAIEELFNGILLWRKVNACGLVAMEYLELVGDILAGLAIHDFAAALAVHKSQINRRTPLAIALALVNAAFAVSPSLCHESPPCRLLSMRFGAWLSFRMPFDLDTIAVCCEVLRAGVKWGVIWLVSSHRSVCGATSTNKRDSAFPHGNDSYAAHCPSSVIPRRPCLAPGDRPVAEYAADTGAPRPDAPAGSLAVPRA